MKINFYDIETLTIVMNGLALNGTTFTVTIKYKLPAMETTKEYWVLTILNKESE